MEIVSNNTIYYTLSTIAQSMAATFALMSAFILYKIQDQSTKIQHIFQKIENDTVMMKQFSNARILMRSHRYKDAISELSNVEIRNTSIKLMVEEVKSEIVRLGYYRRTLIGLIYPSVGIITISTLGLVFVDSFQHVASNGTWLLLLVSVFGTILISIGAVIHKILSDI